MRQRSRYSSGKVGSSPKVALGIAEAIEASVMHAQFVTVPILDARLQELRADMRIGGMSLESKLHVGIQDLESKLHVAVQDLETKIQDLATKTERRFAELEAKFDLRFAEAEKKLDLRFAGFEAKIDVKLGKLETRIEQTKAELVRWIFLVMLGNVALTAVLLQY